MVTEKNKEKYLVISTIIFITYLLLGSFVVSGSILDLGYLIVFYAFIILRLTRSAILILTGRILSHPL